MADIQLNPTIDQTSATSTNLQNLTAGAERYVDPQNTFEQTLADITGTSQSIAYLGSGLGEEFGPENAGNTIVSTAISNLGNGSSLSGPYAYGGSNYGVGGYVNASTGGYNTGYSSGVGYGTTTGVSSSNGSSAFANAVNSEQLDPGNVQQAMRNDSMDMILLMHTVQTESRRSQTMSNIVTESHRANLNNIRNIRS